MQIISTRLFLAGLALYSLVFLTLRLLISSTIGVDDVAETIFAQGWQWGYYPDQPPLYTWLVHLVFNVFGVNMFSLSFLRYGLVFITLSILYQVSRRVIRDPPLAVLATLSVLLFFLVGWGVHVGYTHSTLLMALCVATLYALIEVLERGNLLSYCLLGIATGLGIISKYSFGLFLCSLTLAVICDPPIRGRIRLPNLIVAAAVACVIVGPCAWWLLTHEDVQNVIHGHVLHQTSEYIHVGGGRLHGLWLIVKSSLAFALPFILIAPALFPQGLKPLPAVVSDGTVCYGRLLGRYLICVYTLLVLLVLAGLVTYVQSRWMHPALLFLPLYYFYRVEQVGVKDKGSVRRYGYVLAGVNVVFAILFALQPLFGKELCGVCRVFEPYPVLATQLEASGFKNGTILAEDEHIAANLRVRFPDSRVICLHYPRFTPPQRPQNANGQCMLVWNADRSRTIPDDMAVMMRDALNYEVHAGEPASMVAAGNRAVGSLLRLGYMLWPQGAGQCR